MFAKKEKARIAELEQQEIDKAVAHEENLQALLDKLGDERKASKAQQDAAAIERAGLEQAHAATLEALTRTHELALAVANGHLEEARLKGDRWDSLMFGHKLAVAGRKDVHGESLIEYRCQCSFSVFAPEGFFKIEEPG